MNPYGIYQQQRTLGQTRIDVLLQLYEEAIRRLERVLELLGRGNTAEARPLLAEAKLAVTGLAAGLDPHQGELPKNLLRLYDFILRCLEESGSGKVVDALRILRILQDGLASIRNEAVELERSGAIPPLDLLHVVQVTV